MAFDLKFTLLLALTLLGFLLMVGFENVGAEARCSQLQLQFAWTADAARSVLATWGEDGRARVTHGIYADYLFLIGYSLLLPRLLRAAGSRARWLARGVVLAGGLDALENGFLLGFIQGELDLGLTLLASLMATLKFGLIGAALLHLGARLLAKFGRRC